MKSQFIIKIILVIVTYICPTLQVGFTLKRLDAIEVNGGTTNALQSSTKER